MIYMLLAPLSLTELGRTDLFGITYMKKVMDKQVGKQENK